MKSIRQLVIAFLLISFSAVKAQTCFGDFTSVRNGATVNFTGTVSMNISNIVWDFGDGNFDYTNSIAPSHTYAAAGNYTTCIIVYDSMQTCADSTCHTVVIDSCYGSFTYTMNALSGSFYGYANGAGQNTYYAWNFGDNTTSSQQNPVHTFANPGFYTVCFAYYDLVNGCADSTCTLIYVGNCNADFTTIDSLGYVYFINNSTLGNAGNYMWDFGDGNFSTQQYPSNVYATPGVYQVCLTAYDSMQNFCDSTCHFITVTNVASVNDKINLISSVSIAPNPSDGNTTISFFLPQNGVGTISIYDISGREVMNSVTDEFSSGKQNRQLDTQSLSDGTYFIKLSVNGQDASCRMIVAHKQ